MKHTVRCLAAGLLVFCPWASAQEKSDESGLSGDYGFLPVEVFKLTRRIENLKARDVNADGRQDLVVVDNGQSRIDLLLARDKQPADKPKEDDDREVNDLTDAWRFEHRKVPVRHKIDALTVADFNGDGRPDLCYIGDNHLVVLLGDKDLQWDGRHEHRISDQLLPIPWKLASGDIDGDGCDDLVTLGDTETLIFAGNKQVSLEKLQRLPNTSNRFAHLWLKDLSGNGRLDLLYLSDDDPDRALVARFLNQAGNFGPEYRLELALPRALDLGDLDRTPGTEIVSIDSKTGRVRMHKVRLAGKAGAEDSSPLVQFGFGPRKGGTAGGQHLAVGDVNGDGRTDVVTVDSGAALMSVYLQDPKTGLRQAQQFPGLTGVRGLHVGDLDGDMRAEVVVVSDREKVIAVSRWNQGRLTFPESLPSVDTPLAMCLADFDGSGEREIAYISSSRDGGVSTYTLRKLSQLDQEGWQAGDFNGAAEIKLPNLRSAPAEMLAVDADRDGRSDLMVLGNNAPILFLATSGRGVPVVADSASSNRLGNTEPGRVTLGKLDGQAILIADKSFTRRVQLNADGSWRVVDQYNAENPEANIAGTAILDLDGDKESEIVLVDTGTKALRVLRKKEGVYRPWKNLEIGNFNYRSLIVGDFNDDGRDDLLLFAPDRFGIVFSGTSGPRLDPVGSFESQLRDVKLGDLVIGDLGGGRETDLALVDSDKYRIELITPRAGEWKSALSFKVFEVSRPGAGGREPREMLVADVTGDGLDDLVMIVHDRILLYPQDGGPQK